MATVFINEFHYDNTGTDSNEFIEIAGAAGTDLTGYSIVLYNGNGGTSYNTTNLSGTISDQSNGFGTVAVDISGIQNGSPDGIALVDNNNNVVQFLSYEGSFTATNGPANGMTSVDIGVSQPSSTPVNSSLQLQGEGNEDSEFNWVAVDGSNTKDNINASQTFSENDSDNGDDSDDNNTTEDSITPIYEIQGTAHTSPLLGESVTTEGVVTAVDSNGFYLQDAAGDGDNATSDAIFVFTSSAPTVTVGNFAEVSGTVSEFFPGGADTGNLSTTQISNATVTIPEVSIQVFPTPVVIGTGGRIPPTENINDDAFTSFDPDTDGIDFFESLEAMRVTAQDPLAVAPTNRFGEIFTVVDNGAGATGISDRGTLNISPDDFNPEKVQIDTDTDILPGFDIPEVNVGAQLEDVTGVVSYGFGNFEIIPTEEFSVVTASTLQPETTNIEGGADKLTVASYNVLNLDPNDNDGDEDVANGRFSAIATQIVNNLNAPDVIGLQEIQDNDGSDNTNVTSAAETLQQLVDAIQTAGGPEYEFIDNTFIGNNTSGGQPGGNIRTAFLYNSDRVDFVEDSLTAITDAQAQQTDEDNPFFDSRLPLAAKFTFNGEEVTVVNNHFSSKGGSAPILGVEQPFEQRQEEVEVNGSLDERQAQANAVKGYVDEILTADANANVVVLGDLNEFEFVSPVETLAENLTNLTETVPENERYSFIFQGNSQSLDHILVSDNLKDNAEFDIVQVNSEFADTPQKASDHDPLVASLSFPTENMDKINLSQIGTYTSEDGAEILAHDPQTQRLFVTTGDTVEIIDISDPANPTRFGEIDLSNIGSFVGGGSNSVAVKDGIVAVAVEADTAQDNGIVAFYNTDGELQNSVEVDALPDMLTFTPDGTKVIVANEGEPNDDYTIDPEGSISIIDISGGIANVTTANVTSAGFTGFNDRKQELIEKGVRIFGPNATVAQDLEPEYIAVSADGSTAIVTLQENNAIAVVDIASGTVADVLPLGVKDHSKGQPNLTQYQFSNLPVLGTTATTNPEDSTETTAGQDILLGGLSGLFYEGTAANGNLQFVTVPDRGPNGNSADVDGDGDNDRPFALPDYQARVVKFELNETTGQIENLSEVLLTREDGTTPITGRPNIAGVDEEPVDLFGNLLGYDEFGADLEGVVINPGDGSYWMVDEYRPAIYNFDSTGTLINRFVPQGTGTLGGQPAGTYGTETLPAEYSNRRPNRGFEAVALDTDNGILYSFIQTPLANPDRDASDNSDVIRILGINPTNGEPVSEYVYLLEDPAVRDGGRVDKIGDAVYVGDGKFKVIERDSAVGENAKKFIFEIDLQGATNLLADDAPALMAGMTLEEHTASELEAQGIGVVNKTKVTNLPSIGYQAGDKPEGLALLPDGRLAVLNDNDFGLLDEDIAVDGTVPVNPNPTPVVLGIIDFPEGNQLDASNRDDGINIQNHPILGLYQPDAIDSFEVDGKTFYITANEGDARDYDGFSEETRVEDLTLDPTAYPDAATLQEDENLGRLKTTTALGDYDGDGDVDQIFSYGARSFSIWDGVGNLVFDSGDQIAEILEEQTPDLFNADFDDEVTDDNGDLDFSDSSPSFGRDDRSDDKGAEPESVTVGMVDGKPYGFIGLERAGGGVLVYDLSDPTEPVFNQYIRTEGDVAPEGLQFIAADESPNGKPMLAVANEVSNTTTLYEISENTVSGTDGDDTSTGTDKNDFIDTGDGNDTIDPGAGNDIVNAGAGDDNITSGQGNNQIDGGEGEDTVIYVGNQADFAIARMGNQIKVGNDTLTNVEILQFTDGNLNTADIEEEESNFTLQLLHAADQEAGIPALEDAPNFSAVLNALKDEDADSDGNADYENTLLLSSGDAYIPGIFLDASADESLAPLLGEEGRGRSDIIIQNELGFQAIALGNHEFDLGTGFIASVIAPDGDYPGANFPYLSANLDVSTDENLAPLVAADGQEASTIPGQIAKSAIVTVNGEKIGVVGATTPTLASIASPGDVTISPENPEDIAALAAEIQTSVDALLADNPDLNKVVLISHMQQISIEEELAGLLKNVDIIMAGGSNTLLSDSTDTLRDGDSSEGAYPIIKTDADGKPVAVVNTEGNYRYVGRLVVDFDANGEIITDSIDPAVSGAYATDDAGVAAVNGTPDPEIVAITDALEQVIADLEGNFFGVTDTFLNGTRADVRTQETNLGNLSADANLAIAKQTDPDVVISIKNGGGIRDNIGRVITPPGATEPEFLPPEGNELAGKPEGGISQVEIQNSLRFNNGLTLLTATAEELLAIIEHGVSQSEEGATPGRFPQVSGLSFSFDVTNNDGSEIPAGERVQSLAVVDEDGEVIDAIAQDGELLGDASRTFRLVTLGFLAGGGDDYPFPERDVVELAQEEDAARTGNATFAPDGSEQDALAEFLAANFSEENPFSEEDVPPAQDMRIQNLDFREDTVLEGFVEEIPIAATTLADGTTVESIDLTGFTGQATINYTISREADFDNEVYFYEVDNINGTVDGIAVGEAGYMQAALDNIISPEFSTSDDNTETASAQFDAGSVVVPLIIADGTLAEALSGDADIYFPYLGANTDNGNFDHIRLLDENTFGFEDLPNGGDQDFNDIEIRINSIA